MGSLNISVTEMDISLRNLLIASSFRNMGGMISEMCSTPSFFEMDMTRRLRDALA